MLRWCQKVQLQKYLCACRPPEVMYSQQSRHCGVTTIFAAFLSSPRWCCTFFFLLCTPILRLPLQKQAIRSHVGRMVGTGPNENVVGATSMLRWCQKVQLQKYLCACRPPEVMYS